MRTVAVSQTSTGLDQSCEYLGSLEKRECREQLLIKFYYRGFYPSLSLDSRGVQHGNNLCVSPYDAPAAKFSVSVAFQRLFSE